MKQRLTMREKARRAMTNQYKRAPLGEVGRMLQAHALDYAIVLAEQRWNSSDTERDAWFWHRVWDLLRDVQTEERAAKEIVPAPVFAANYKGRGGAEALGRRMAAELGLAAPEERKAVRE